MILFYLLVLVMPLAEHPLWGGSFGGVTIVKYLGIGSALVAVLRVILKGRLPRFFGAPQVKIFLLLYLIVIASYIRSDSIIPVMMGPLATYTSFLVLIFVVNALVDTRLRLRRTVLIAFGSIAFAALYLIREWQKGVAMYGIGFRPGWVTGDGNYYALCAVLLYPLAVFTFLKPQRKVDRIYAAVCLLLSSAGLVLTASRGGFLGMAVSGMFMMLFSKHRVKIAVFGLGVLVVALFLIPSSAIQRLTEPSAGDKQSTQFRMELWSAGARMLVENPVWGVGLGGFGAALPNYGGENAARFHVPHNTYLTFGAEMGFPGVLTFLLLLILAIYQVHKLRRNAKNYGDEFIWNIGNAIEAGLIGASVSIFFLSAEHTKPLWFLIALSVALPRLLEKQTVQEVEEPNVQFNHAELLQEQ